MDVRNGPNEQEFKEIIRLVSTRDYGENLREIDLKTVRANLIRGRMGVWDNCGPGSRTSWTGRHTMQTACWHACRDVLRELFRRYPDATVIAGRSWRVTYRGSVGFERAYPLTSHVNIGSQIAPVIMLDLCQCSDNDDDELQGPCTYGRACIYGCQPIPPATDPSDSQSTVKPSYRDGEVDFVTTFNTIEELLSTYGNQAR